MRDKCYAIDDPAAIATIRSGLTQLFGGIREVTGAEAFDVWDSFDWRLFNKGWLLLQKKDAYALIDHLAGQRLHTMASDGDRTRAFHWEFPASGLAEALKPVLEMRALLPLGRIDKRSVRFDLLNQDEKTVARLALETYSGQNHGAAVSVFRLTPVRGYVKAAEKVADCLKRAGLKPFEQSPIQTVLERQGFSPGAYSSKITVSLQPEMTALSALRRILGSLVSVMQSNLPGLRQDIDTEFLHDFRVSVRRARSLLSQMKGVVGAETTTTLQQRLKSLGAITGNVRDLDVVLLKEAEYRGLLPEVLKPGIVQLFRTLHQKRRRARDRMLTAMAGADFAAALAELDAFALTAPDAGTGGPDGGRPIAELAKAAIYKRYRRVIKHGGRISGATADAKLHALRIDCKKLRYLLEFFASLFPEDDARGLIKHLKQLQDNLGAFNDLSVQQNFLIDFMETAGPKDVMLSAATGGLITRLFEARGQVRAQFFQTFEAFKAPDNQMRFKTLFS